MIKEKHLKTLEYFKVLSLLEEAAPCEEIKKLCAELRPQGEYELCVREMEKTECAYNLGEKFGAPSFSDVKNIKPSLVRASAGAVLSLKELLDIACVLRNIRAVLEWKRRHEIDYGILTPFFEGLLENKALEERIFECIESEESVSDRASEELFRIRRKIASAKEGIRDKLDRLIRSSQKQKYLQESIVTTRDGRFVVPVKSEYRGEIQGLVHDTSSSGATLFIEPMAVVELNNEIRILVSKEKIEIDRIIASLSQSVGARMDEISGSLENLLELGFYFTKATFARSIKATCPKLNDEGVVELKKARHPLIDKDKVVPIDLRLGVDFDALVITGPNTGGKTVSIKTLGLLSLMAMSGLYVPVSEGSRISFFRSVLADIGDEQSIEQSLSTFSSHMKNISDILMSADDKSLVLLDELGAGTDPVEGAALAESIVDTLIKKGAKIATTTHYAELKVYALQTDRVINASCEFDVEELRPTYKLNIGALGRSNAFHISLRLGIPEEIISRAKTLIESDNKRFEDVIGALEDRRLELNKEYESLIKQKESFKEERAGFLQKKEKLAEEIIKESEKKAKLNEEKAERLAAQASALMDELEAIRKEKNKGNLDKIAESARKSLEGKIGEIDKLVAKNNTAKKPEGTPVKEAVPGKKVMVASLKKEAVILSYPDKNNMVNLQIGVIKTKADLQDLVEISKSKNSGPAPRKTEKVFKASPMSIDLRGQNSEEAIMELDRFIDNAVLSHVPSITIIHGKGTGVLRKAVNSHLKNHKNIRTFRLGVFSEGEDGVTIAEIK